MTPGFGAFALGGMRLALPLTALREVVAGAAMGPLPCEVPGVCGGIELRGLMLPVLDLRIVLDREAPPLSSPSVVVLEHAGRLLGLLADRLGAVFHREAGAVQALAGTPGGALLEAVVLDDDGAASSVLSTAALAALPGLPMAHETAPVDDAGAAAQAAPRLTLLLVRCGGSGFAIAATAVHTTLALPRVEPSPLAMGACRGVVRHAGDMIPAIDMPALCGIGALADAASRQALVIERPAGRVALLVDEVTDIVEVVAADVSPLPQLATTRVDLFAGALAPEALHPDSSARRHDVGAAWLVLDEVALGAHELVAALSGVNTPVGDGPGGAREGAPLPGRAMLTCRALNEFATPLEHVVEVLPYEVDPATAEPDGPMLGLTMHRGRSVAVLCLAQLLAPRAPRPADSRCVLLVESADGLIGFAVTALLAIEPAQWEPQSPRRRLVLVGEAQRQRMLPVVDLVALAARLAPAQRSRA